MKISYLILGVFVLVVGMGIVSAVPKNFSDSLLSCNSDADCIVVYVANDSILRNDSHIINVSRFLEANPRVTGYVFSYKSDILCLSKDYYQGSKEIAKLDLPAGGIPLPSFFAESDCLCGHDRWGDGKNYCEILPYGAPPVDARESENRSCVMLKSLNSPCSSDSDCVTSGCAGEVCSGKSDVFGGGCSAMALPECYEGSASKSNKACGCNNNKCSWAKKNFMNLSNGKKAEIKIMPETASQTAIQRLGQIGFNVTLREVGNGNESRAVYRVEGEKEGKFLGLFKINGKVSIDVDAETGDVVSTRRPWWAFLASGI